MLSGDTVDFLVECARGEQGFVEGVRQHRCDGGKCRGVAARAAEERQFEVECGLLARGVGVVPALVAGYGVVVGAWGGVLAGATSQEHVLSEVGQARERAGVVVRAGGYGDGTRAECVVGVTNEK